MFAPLHMPKLTRFIPVQLNKLHHQFFHPSPDKLFNLIKRSRPERATPETLKALEEINARCDLVNGSKRHHFDFESASVQATSDSTREYFSTLCTWTVILCSTSLTKACTSMWRSSCRTSKRTPPERPSSTLGRKSTPAFPIKFWSIKGVPLVNHSRTWCRSPGLQLNKQAPRHVPA